MTVSTFFGQQRAKFWLVLLAAIALPTSAQALTTISQGYSTSDKLSLGSIVSLEKDSIDRVNAASVTNPDSVLGVVISDGNSLLSLTDGKDTQVQVTTSGIAQVLVSDINGKIVQGDQITASPIAGVGMKATTSVKVLGIAQDDLTDKSSNEETYTDKDKQKKSVRIGTVPVLVNVSYFYKQPDKTVIPSTVQSIANALAGKPVDPLPVIISVAIFVVTLVVVVSIIYSIIHSSIISVGRNPMSQSAIYRNILQLSALVVAILAVAIVSIYMILTRF